MRNLFEKKVHLQLKKSKLPFGYETEKVPYHWVGHYTPDFVVKTPHGKIYIECKGYFRPEDKRKLAAVKRLNPHMDLRIVFYNDNKRNIKWAIKNGFMYSISKIPKEWLT